MEGGGVLFLIDAVSMTTSQHFRTEDFATLVRMVAKVL